MWYNGSMNKRSAKYKNTLTFKASDKQLKRLRDISTDRGVPLAKLLRLIVTNWLRTIPDSGIPDDAESGILDHDSGIPDNVEQARSSIPLDCRHCESIPDDAEIQKLRNEVDEWMGNEHNESSQ